MSNLYALDTKTYNKDGNTNVLHMVSISFLMGKINRMKLINAEPRLGSVPHVMDLCSCTILAVACTGQSESKLSRADLILR